MSSANYKLRPLLKLASRQLRSDMKAIRCIYLLGRGGGGPAGGLPGRGGGGPAGGAPAGGRGGAPTGGRPGTGGGAVFLGGAGSSLLAGRGLVGVDFPLSTSPPLL